MASSLKEPLPEMSFCAWSPRALQTLVATAARSPTGWAQLRPLPKFWSKVSNWSVSGRPGVSFPVGLFLTGMFTWDTKASSCYPFQCPALRPKVASLSRKTFPPILFSAP